jgi:arylsulfatase A-like enzyme/Flp pilus assembly protein TadD
MIRSSFKVASILVVLLLYWPSASKSRPSPARPDNAILITVDTLRADHLECYGYHQIKTPNINRLAQEGILFSKAYAHVPLTLPSHWSILTGTYPLFHGVRDNAYFEFRRDIPTLTEVLQSNGYSTAAFVGSFVLDRRFGLARGFENYFDNFVASKYQGISGADVQWRGDRVTAEWLKWLGENKNRKFFTWVHLFDPHDPYDPPEPFKTIYTKAPYDGEVAFVDRLIGNMIGFLESEGLLQNTLIIFTSDHGEALGEHLENTHGLFLYEPSLHVPLIIRSTDPAHRGTVVDSPVRSIDIAPTILQFLGFQRPSSMQGAELLSLSLGGKPKNQFVSYSESYYARFHFGWSELKAISDGRFKFVDAPKPELYDLRADPEESKNIYSQSGVISRKMRQLLLETTKKLSAPITATPQTKPPDPATLERLKSLGYMGGPSRVNLSQSGKLRPDPKDKIHLYLKIQEAITASNQNRTQEAINLLGSVVAKDRTIPAVRLALGIEYQRTGDYRTAAKEFRGTLEQDPQNVLATFNLALSNAHLKNLDGAVLGFRRTLELDPTYSKAHTNLGIIYQSQNKPDEAIREYNRALKVDENDFAALHNLAVILAGRGMLEEAMAKAKKAMVINPDNAEAYNTLGSIHQLGKRYDEAADAYREAIRRDAKLVQAHINLGLIFMHKGMVDEALEACKKAAEIDPLNAEAHYYLGKLYLQKGMAKEAEEEFTKHKQLSSTKR